MSEPTIETAFLTPRKALNKAFLKVKPNRTEIECFKANLIQLLDRINEAETEEFHKNLVSDFLKDTYYKQNHYINTKGRNDLVIHNGDKPTSTVGIIIEAKSPTNKSEMLKVYTKDDSTEQRLAKINVKAFQELVLYYLRERITQKNLEVKYLIATNINEWFIFDAIQFDRLFAQNKKLVGQFIDFEGARLAETKTDFFYKQIAEPFIRDLKQSIEFTYFDIWEYEKPLRNKDKNDDYKLISLFKLLSPEHLLKLPFANDSNSLDKRFYGELLHIIGLTETKNGSKKLIERNKEGERNSGSLLENAIIQLDSLDKISRLDNPKQYGATQAERLFTVGLELCITWVNRILFLKLLEAQLITYHKGDKSYEFLRYDHIKDYDDLNSLFFQVLARRQNERNDDVKTLFANVPYLNSSLFEPTEIEHSTLFISNLRDDKSIPLYSSTVLKDDKGKKRTGFLNPLEYFFEFLNAYDFSSEGSEEIQEDNKTLINASVLGLIFEKINGYKDGSFFTPGFITMYMCRETIRKAVLQKFKDAKGWDCADLNALYDKIENRNEANALINDLKICDPAVGSGHFLVSALNEIIAIKHDLKILQDRSGKRLKEYQFEVVNDELIVTDEDGDPFEYNPTNQESQRIQETLFHEKQIIIENCLFGVDINPNSVKICRLRLWVELLKNAYYKNETELETLPNIDINIKCGNSLISRFALDADLKQALKKSESKWSIDSYRLAVDSYRNASNKEEKREMERLINEIKSNFRSEISKNDPKVKRLSLVNGELFTLANQGQLFELAKKEKAIWNAKVQKLTAESTKLEAEIEEIKANKIFENAFEWRFEFPEVLDENGDFVGFDVVIGNPPYVGIEDIEWEYRRYYETVFKTAKGRFDLYSLFIEKAMQVKIQQGVFTFIIPGKFLNNKQSVIARKMICENHSVSIVIIEDKVFCDAQVNSLIVENFASTELEYKAFILSFDKLQLVSESNVTTILKEKEVIFRLEISDNFDNLISKIEDNTVRIKDIAEVKDGIVAGSIKDVLYLSEKVNDDCHKLYFGKNLSKYYLSDSNTWVNYKPDEMMKEELKRKDGKRTGLWMRDERIFNREKILSRFVAKEIIASYDNDNRYYEHTLHSTHVLDKRFKPKFILGLFNSVLFKFYYIKTNSQGGNLFPQVRISSVEQLPIKLANLEVQGAIESLVDRIMFIKHNDKLSDSTDLEAQIDQLVYQLYDLTDEEIAIIEESVK